MKRPGEAAVGGRFRMEVAHLLLLGRLGLDLGVLGVGTRGRPPLGDTAYLLLILSTNILFTDVSISFSGTHIRDSRKRKLIKKDTMGSTWKYAMSQVKGEGKSALELLNAETTHVLVLVREYCVGMPVVDTFVVPGALPQVKSDGSTFLEEKALLTQPAQEIIRAVLMLLEELFKAGYFLLKIDDSTFLFDRSSGRVRLSDEAISQQVRQVTSSLDVDNTITLAAKKLEEWVFTQNNCSPAEVPEVSDGLFKLMASNGDENWYAIINNMALVPVENRREVYMRLYEQLLDVVQKRKFQDYLDILQDLEFPMTWHDAISPEINGILFNLYAGAVYDATATTKKEQAQQITRLFRNSGAHGLEKLSHWIGRADVARVNYALAPLLAVSLQAALQKRNWLVSTEIHTLIVYSHQSYS